MKIRFFISAIVLSPLLSGLVFSSTAAASAAQSESCVSQEWPHELSELAPDPDIVFGRLDNGFRYVLRKNENPKNRTAIQLNVNAGSLNELDEESGIAHFLEHMVFNGSTHFKPGELIDYFQDIGMSYGGDTNAYTTYEDTVYKIILPASDRKMLEDGLLVMRDYASGALLDQAEIDRERNVILAEMNERNTASFRTYKESSRFSLEGTLVPERFAIGRKDVLEGAGRGLIKRFYEKWYRPGNMFLVMVGDFDTAVAETVIAEQFNTMKASAEPFSCPDYGTLDHKGIDTFYYYEPDLGYTSVSVEILGNKKPENDSFQLQLKNLHRYMAARIINFRLDQEREKQDSVFSSGHFYFNSILDRFQQSALVARTSGENWKPALAGINRIINQAIEYGFSVEETEMVKEELIGYLRRGVLTSNTRDSLALSRDIINSINSNRVIQSPLREEQLYATPIRNTTPQDLHDALREIWGQDVRLVEVIGDAQIDGGDPEEVVKQYYDMLQQQEIAQKSIEKLPDFPYLPETDEIGPIKRERLELADATRFIYANNMVLNVKKTLFKENSAAVAVHFGDGEKSLPKAGLSLLAEAVVNRSGTGTLRESEISRVLAGSSVNYRFRIGDESLSLAGNALSSDLETLLQVFQAIVLDPGLRSDAYESAMKRFEIMYRGMNSDINGAAELYLAPFFAGNALTEKMPSWEDFKTLTLDDVRAWLLPQFEKASLEISIVGDVEEAEIVTLVSKYFGGLASKEYREMKTAIVPLFPAGKSHEVSIGLKEDKALVQMAWLTDDFWDIKKTRRLHVLAALIDERLRKLVREKSGESYSPAAFSTNSRIFPDYGKIVIEVMTDAESLDPVVGQIGEVIQSFHDDPVGTDELERSKQPAITSIKEHIQTNGYWLSSVLSLSTRHPQILDWPTTLLDDFSSISAADVSKLVADYLVAERRAVGIIRAERGD